MPHSHTYNIPITDPVQSFVTQTTKPCSIPVFFFSMSTGLGDSVVAFRLTLFLLTTPHAVLGSRFSLSSSNNLDNLRPSYLHEA